MVVLCKEAIPLTVGKDAAGNTCEIMVVVCAEKRRKQRSLAPIEARSSGQDPDIKTVRDGSRGPISTTTQPQHYPPVRGLAVV